MMKITQLLTNLKLWQSTFVAFIFLFSFSINSQNIGDDLMAATNGALSTEQVTGSGTGCAPCGWTATNGTNYAPTNNNSHGAVHSPDRMWKMFANNSGNGEFVAQEFSQLPLGTYTLTFYHKWTNCGNLDYSNGGPALSFKKSDGSGGWANVNDPIEVPQSNCGANADWTEMTVTYEVTEVDDYRMQIYKNGANGLNASLHLDTFSFVYTAAASSDGCDLTINMEDTYGDGWNGNYLDVYVNGELSQGGLTIDNGDSATATVSASYGDTVLFDMVAAGSYIGETQFNVTDADGNTVASAADGDDATFECIDPNAVNLAVSATTDGASATFTFDIANFTVGEAGSGADGHIHYSLNGGSEVMIYSSDALTLSDLPNGDHTIVFSLVDESHQPLDPAVEATVEFSTFSGIVDCGGTASICYDSTNSTELWFSSTAPEGQVASVTFAGGTESGYDYVIVTNGAGTAIGDPLTGDLNGVTVTSDDNGLMVYLDTDGSWSCQSGQSGFASLDATVSCAVPQTAVTFTVNTANIEVGENGMYVGGGVLGDALAYAMTDDDADGTYEVTVNLDQGTTGNYVFLNSPNDGGDWDAKEILDGQECADANNWNDRLLPEITGDAMTIQHCFGSCESDGTCPAAVDTYEVTFSVDTANYPGGLGESDTVYLNGNFNGWCGECNPMSDDDGDGIWTVTISLADGDYEYKFTVNGWSSQEEFSEVVEGCTISDGTYTNRALTVAGEDMVLPTVYWNLCAGETPGEVYNVTFNLDATGIEVGANGMYMGGGILGGANAVAMSDDDGDGIWTVTIEISTDQIGGNYTFLNSPNDGGDWDAKEDISGQECADADNYNDRIVPEFSGDAEFCYVFALCTDGVCAEEPVTFPICEDFEGEDGAAGWTFIDAGGATSDWLLDTPANTGDQSIGHGYLPSDVAYNDWAVSPSYNTSGLAEGTATVSYYEYLNWSADAQAHNVYYTLDYAGDATTATWVLLTDVIGTDAEDVFVQRTFNIPSAESVVIGFQYLNTYGADWNIDDMCIDGTLSTTDTEILDMRIYPNPTSSMINVQFDRDIELTLYNMLGQEIMRTNNKQVDISALQQGNYIVIVRDLESNYVKNFNIIKK
ncbi:MAG: T9SS type A sorting domain-containing protein [Flavobacteriaceae bacterium]